MNLNIEDIKNLIPHRKPFLFIEELKVIEKGKIGESFRTFEETEYFFEGHFPNNPIVPGVVIVEAMAQTAGVVVSENLSKNNDQSVLFMRAYYPIYLKRAKVLLSLVNTMMEFFMQMKFLPSMMRTICHQT